MANVASAEKVKRRKLDILDASMDVFASKGFHKAGMADIASKLNVGHGTIYRYYKNKRDIFDAISQQGFSRVVEVIANNPPNADSFEEYCLQLKNISNGLAAIFVDDPRYAKIIFDQTSSVDPEIAKHVKGLVASITKEYLKNGVDKCFLRQSMNQTVASHMITAMMIEIISQTIDKDPSEIAIDDWNQEMLAIMINGISL